MVIKTYTLSSHLHSTLIRHLRVSKFQKFGKLPVLEERLRDWWSGCSANAFFKISYLKLFNEIKVNMLHSFEDIIKNYQYLVLPNEPDQPDPPLTRPFDPGGQPDPPLFATLRDQPDSTRFFTLGVGFNPIQPYSTRIKNFTFFQLQIFSYFFCCCNITDLSTHTKIGDA